MPAKNTTRTAAKPAPKPAAAKPAAAPAAASPAPAAPSNGRTLTFVSAPPKVTRQGGGRTHGWGDVIAQLKANEGQWAILGTYTSAGNRPKALKEAGITLRTLRQRDAGGNILDAEDGSAVFEMWGCYNPAE
jgi:hypothetical protein